MRCSSLLFAPRLGNEISLSFSVCSKNIFLEQSGSRSSKLLFSSSLCSEEASSSFCILCFLFVFASLDSKFKSRSASFSLELRGSSVASGSAPCSRRGKSDPVCAGRKTRTENCSRFLSTGKPSSEGTFAFLSTDGS